MNDEIPRPSWRDGLRAALFLPALLACAFGTPSSAGQASTSFRVIITSPTPMGSCTAAVDEAGRPLVNCRSELVAVPESSTKPAGGLQGYQLPDVRVKGGGAHVDVADGSHSPWGEYSSRLVVGREIAYLEMTVAW